MNNEPKLFRVMFYIRPTPQHPLYFKAQNGLLFVWLFDDSALRAFDRAKNIVKELPYEVAEEPFYVSDMTDVKFDQNNDDPKSKIAFGAQLDARHFGLGLGLAIGEIGVEDIPEARFAGESQGF